MQIKPNFMMNSPTAQTTAIILSLLTMSGCMDSTDSTDYGPQESSSPQSQEETVESVPTEPIGETSGHLIFHEEK